MKFVKVKERVIKRRFLDCEVVCMIADVYEYIMTTEGMEVSLLRHMWVYPHLVDFCKNEEAVIKA